MEAASTLSSLADDGDVHYSVPPLPPSLNEGEAVQMLKRSESAVIPQRAVPIPSASSSNPRTFFSPREEPERMEVDEPESSSEEDPYEGIVLPVPADATREEARTHQIEMLNRMIRLKLEREQRYLTFDFVFIHWY